MTLGTNIRTYRKKRGLTLQALADKVGKSKSFLCDIENGHKNPSIRTARLIARELKVSIGRLLHD